MRGCKSGEGCEGCEGCSCEGGACEGGCACPRGGGLVGWEDGGWLGSDPILVATAFKKQRFFLFTTREPAADLVRKRGYGPSAFF